jgi:hypothetical protein
VWYRDHGGDLSVYFKRRDIVFDAKKPVIKRAKAALENASS